MPDPMGLSFDTENDRLLITDSEIEEFNAPYWHGANYFELERSGAIARTLNISTKGVPITQPNPLGFTNEPADLAFANNPFGAVEGNHYFIVDDNSSRLYDVALGSDKTFDLTDPRTDFKTHAMGQDAEGLGFGMVDVGGTPEPNLFIAMGEGPPSSGETGANVHEIYRIRPGANGRFDGPPGPRPGSTTVDYPLSDDIVTHFDTCKPTSTTGVSISSPCTSPLNQPDPEDVAYDSQSNHLFFTSHHTLGTNTIVTETTLDGTLLGTWDLGIISGIEASGIVIARASAGGSSSRSIYITSRGVDNDSSPNENDGKLYEWQIEGPINHAPLITNPGNKSSNEGLEISPVAIQVSDPDVGDTVTVAVAGLPNGLTFDPATKVISGTIPYGGWTGSQTSRQHTVLITATDSVGAVASASFVWTVIRDLTPPAMPGALTIGRQTTGLMLDWPDNTEADLAGYKVARATSASPGVYTDLTPTPLEPGTSEFFDDTAPPGLTSSYKLTAIDHAVPANTSPARTGSARRSKIVLVSSSKNVAAGPVLAIPKPDGVEAGDVLVAGIAARDAATVVAPPGWTLAAQMPRVTSLSQQVVYTHTVAADDPATFNFIAIGRSASVGVIMAYRGAVERPASVGGQANVVSERITAPSVTPTANDSVQIGFFGIDVEALVTSPAGMMTREWQPMFVDPIGLTLTIADTVLDAVPAGQRIAIASSAAENVGQVVVLSPKP